MRCREDEEFEEANLVLQKISTSSSPLAPVYEGEEGFVYISSHVDLPLIKSELEIRSCPYAVAGVSGQKVGNGMKFWDEASMTFAEMIQVEGFDDGRVNENGRVLELGCGATGVPGLALGCCGLATVVDFMDCDPMCLRELSSNIRRNLVKQHENREGDSELLAEFNILPTCTYEDIVRKGGVFLDDGQHVVYDVIIGCELVFDEVDIDLLAQCIMTLLMENNRFILCQSVKGRGKVFEFIVAMLTSRRTECSAHENDATTMTTTVLKCFQKCDGSDGRRGQWVELKSIEKVRQMMELREILLLSFEAPKNV